MKNTLLVLVLLITFQFQAQNKPQDLIQKAELKIKDLEKLMIRAKKQRIDVLKEEVALTTAKTFLKFAAWDESNVEVNTELFEKVAIYKKNATQMAEKLPRFERKEVIAILENAIKEINSLIARKTKRKPSVDIDWSKASVEGDEVVYNNRPVFLSDYRLKPSDAKLNKYFGNRGGFYVTPSYLSDEGLVNQRVIDKLARKPDGTLGFISLNHRNVPKWSLEAYGEDFEMRENIGTGYDIDNPGAKSIQKNLLSEVVPYMAGKKFSELGYMIADYSNYDHHKKSLEFGGVSKYTKEKFKKWLENKHQTVEKLNTLWGTNFKDFKSIEVVIPMDVSLKGKPIWYDWTLFNMNRVTDWYRYIKKRIVKDDPDANVHLKTATKLWTNNKRQHGVDLEALTSLSGIIGNSTGAEHIRIWGKPHRWEKRYVFDWRELCMGYDFMKSVSPDKLNYNTESHLLSTNTSKDLYLDPMYARASFWLAHTYGMNASLNWFWPREVDGSVDKVKVGEHYVGTNNQQAKVTHEVAMTMIDLNSNAEEIRSMQKQRKSLRIFYSKTSAINKDKHMDDVFDLYESLNFNGTPIGFVTEDILNKQDIKNWDAVLIRKTEFVTQKEFSSIQMYLNKGGKVYIDAESLKKDEYGKPLEGVLSSGKGKLIELTTLQEFENKPVEFLKNNFLLPRVSVSEINANGEKGCVWRVVKNSNDVNVLSVVNVGNKEATLNITLNGSNEIKCTDIINGIEKSSKPVLKPYEVYFVEVTQ